MLPWPCGLIPCVHSTPATLAPSLYQHGWFVPTTACVHLSSLLLGRLHTPCSFASLSRPYSHVTFSGRLVPTIRLTPSSNTQFSPLPFFGPIFPITFEHNIYCLFMGLIIYINSMKKGNFVCFIHYFAPWPRECLPCRRSSINVYWMNESMNELFMGPWLLSHQSIMLPSSNIHSTFPHLVPALQTMVGWGCSWASYKDPTLHPEGSEPLVYLPT